MGWWKIQHTETVIGDQPLDTLQDAIKSIVELYNQAFNRAPTRDEWSSLLELVFDPSINEGDVITSGAPIRRVIVE